MSKRSRHTRYYRLRRTGNPPRLGLVACFIVIFVITVLAIRSSDKAKVKETYVARTYGIEAGKIVETEYTHTAEYRVDMDQLNTGISFVLTNMRDAEDVSYVKNSVSKPTSKKVTRTEAIIRKHYPESTYIKGAIMLNGEAGGVESITERSGPLWTVCNRELSDDPFYAKGLEAIIEQEWQFTGYKPDGKYTQADYDLAVDVFERFYREQHGESSEAVGRTLPQDYLFFTGDGEHNYFTKVQNGTPYVWGSVYVSPYKN